VQGSAVAVGTVREPHRKGRTLEARGGAGSGPSGGAPWARALPGKVRLWVRAGSEFVGSGIGPDRFCRGTWIPRVAHQCLQAAGTRLFLQQRTRAGRTTRAPWLPEVRGRGEGAPHGQIGGSGGVGSWWSGEGLCVGPRVVRRAVRHGGPSRRFLAREPRAGRGSSKAFSAGPAIASAPIEGRRICESPD